MLVSVGSIEEVILARARQKRAVDAKVIQAGMFNGRSSADDRRAMLQQILSGDGLGGRGLDGASVVTAPSELNSLIARSEEEIELFDAMDEASPPLGLLAEHELPAWVTAGPARNAAAEAEAEAEAEALASGVRRKRLARQGVSYADGLSDAKWLKIVDSGGDLEALKAAAAERGERKRRRSGDKSKRRSSARGDDDTPPAKRGRRSGGAQRSGVRATRGAAQATQKNARATRANGGRRSSEDDDDDEDGDDDDESSSDSGSDSGSGSGSEGEGEDCGEGGATAADKAAPADGA